MKIKELWFRNNRHKWELEKTAFSDLTLLVGASGVGKTQILYAIMKLISISKGYAYNGVEWDFHFTASKEGEDYRWTGEFECVEETDQQEFKEEEVSGNGIPKLLNEKLYLDDKLVFERDNSKLKYEEKEAPKISPYKSVLNLFTTEDKIKPIRIAFEHVNFIDYDSEKIYQLPKNYIIERLRHINEGARVMQKGAYERTLEVLEKKGNKNVSKKYKKEDIEKFYPVSIIQNINLADVERLALVHKSHKEYFEEVVSDFKDIFPLVEDVRFKFLEEKDVYELQIKERGTDWISRREISSGMFKTLMHIAEMRLLAKGSVVLIDEFENSLGVNCIDAVAGDLVSPDRDLQYIITSHHPYIINNIDMKYWKLVMRKGSKVFTKNAEQLKLGKSKHEAFKQLLNLEEFAEGIS